jgi:hypothetical protein
MNLKSKDFIYTWIAPTLTYIIVIGTIVYLQRDVLSLLVNMNPMDAVPLVVTTIVTVSLFMLIRKKSQFARDYILAPGTIFFLTTAIILIVYLVWLWSKPTFP